MIVSLCYVLLRWLLEFVALRVRSKEYQELEIIVLRQEQTWICAPFTVYLAHGGGVKLPALVVVSPAK